MLANDYFDSLGTAASSIDGEIFATASAATQTPTPTTRRGIWQFCNGAPQVRALSAQTGALGPNLPGNAAATFSSFMPIIAPTTSGDFYFSAVGASPTFKGVFHHHHGENQPILLNDASGALGPGIAGFAFDQLIDFHPRSAGRFGLVYARIREIGGSSERFGLWRLQPGSAPEPVLLIGDGSSHVPAAGRRWDSVSAYDVLDNGVVVLLAATSAPPVAAQQLGVWRLRPGHVPEEVLGSGDLVRYPTTAGMQMRAVRSVSDTFVASGSAGRQDRAGDDSWISASGHALVEVALEGMEGLVYPTRYVRARVSNPDVLLQDGFE